MIGRRLSALALLLSCASAPIHANVGTYGGDCWQGRELEALKVQRYKTMLLVAMLNCRDQEPFIGADYNRFVRANHDLIAENQAVVRQHFIRSRGPAAGLTAYSSYETSLGNRFSNENFSPRRCADAAAEAREASYVSEGGLMDMIQSVPDEGDLAICRPEPQYVARQAEWAPAPPAPQYYQRQAEVAPPPPASQYYDRQAEWAPPPPAPQYYQRQAEVAPPPQAPQYYERQAEAAPPPPAPQYYQRQAELASSPPAPRVATESAQNEWPDLAPVEPEGTARSVDPNATRLAEAAPPPPAPMPEKIAEPVPVAPAQMAAIDLPKPVVVNDRARAVRDAAKALRQALAAQALESLETEEGEGVK